MATKKKNPQTAIKKKVTNTKKRTSLALVPKKENQYRPLLVRRYGLMLVIAAVIAMQFGYNFTQTGSVLGRVTTITTNGLLVETNDRRADVNAPSLKLNDQLSRAAMLKANDIIQNQYWDHVSPDGVEPWDWIDGTGYTYHEAGENLAKNFATAGGTVAGWMGSEDHRNNMLKASYSDVGFAVTTGELHGKPTTIVVALYAKPSKAPGLAAPSSPYKVSASSGNSDLETKPLSLASRIGIAIQSLTPAAITSVALLFVAATVATTAHAYRKKLPKRLQKTWYKDHGVIKASGLLTIAAFIVLLYGGGSL
ncbi:hypothetical protein B7Y94_01480 [Candidatus Saccharibacteria bacterium 32-49-12]|nr:MAG: hypothetical protein B7Y94_01480 [Candidatus Saccharibacteria bacterium 32-49-12]